MFSWSKKSDSKKKTRRRGGSGGPVLNEFGLPMGQTSGGNDEELEAELRALTGGVISPEDDLELNDDGSDVEAEFRRLFSDSKGKKKKSKKAGVDPVSKIDDEPLDVGGDFDIDEEGMNDEDIDVDENDPELLSELMGLTEGDEEEEEEEEEEEGDDDNEEPSSEEKEPEKKEVTVISMLKERLNMYKMAEAKAKENNESSRARRFGRGIKTLQQLIKKAEANQPVLPSEIPPVIATNLKPAPPPPVTNLPDKEVISSSDIVDPGNDAPTNEMRNLSIDTRPKVGEIYHDPPKAEPIEEPVKEPVEAPAEEPLEEPVEVPVEEPVEENAWLSVLRSRRDEYKDSALMAKRNNDLETALKHVKCVKQLNALITAVEQGEDIEESEIPPSLRKPARPHPPPKTIEKLTPLKFEAPDDVEEYEIPKTVLEALNQRLRIYQGFKRESEKIGDEVGVRRNSKIVEIYSEAIKLHKAGKKVPLAKLPTPPGCPPIPIPFELD